MIAYDNQDIGGYDMVISVTQSEINAQLKLLFMRGIDRQINQKLPDGTSLKAALAAPTVLFKADIGTQANQRVFLILHLRSGTFTALGNKETRIEDWKVAVKVVLKIGPISPKEIENHNGIPEGVKDQLKQFDEINFKVNQLYIDFKSSGRAANIERGLSTIPREMPPNDYESFGRLLEAHLQGFSGAQNPYNLGYVPTITGKASFKADPEKSLFEPTGVRFSITDCSPRNENTLNYMLMTSHREFPTGELSGIVRFNAFRPMKGSVMRLSQRIFIETFILARIQKELNMPKFSGGATTWTANRETNKPEQRYQLSGNEEVWMRFEELYSCSVSFKNGSRPEYGKCGIIEASGIVKRKVWYRYERDGKDHDLTGELKWDIELYVTVSNGKLFINRNNPTWKVSFDVLTEQWFDNISRHGSQGGKEQARIVREYLSYYTREFLAMLRIHFRSFENILILPAGDAFFFKELEFNTLYRGLNLLQTLTYKSL
jgi:hypothetical protein